MEHMSENIITKMSIPFFCTIINFSLKNDIFSHLSSLPSLFRGLQSYMESKVTMTTLSTDASQVKSVTTDFVVLPFGP